MPITIKISVDKFHSNSRKRASALAVIILSGSGGLKSRNLPYRDEATLLAENGYDVYLPHYLDATRGSRAYPVLVRAVHDAITAVLTKGGPKNVVLIGYSLGSSVALAEASQDVRIKGVVAWSGGLPDEYFHTIVALPPLLIFHGEKNSVIPIADAVQLSRLCELLKTPCEFYAFPGESHRFSAGAISQANQFILRFLASLSGR